MFPWRNLILLLWGIVPFSLFGQSIEYGLNGNVNISSIYHNSRDSFISGASWGVSMFAEKQLSTQWSLSIHPGFQQVGFGSETSIVSWLNGNIEIPVKMHYSPKNMENGRLHWGLNPSYQVSKYRVDPSGSNPDGKRNQPLKISQPFQPGMMAGLDFKISDGFHFSLSYHYFLNTTYGMNNISGRPAHWQFGLQLRLNELANRKIHVSEKDTLKPFGYLIVLLPEQYHRKGLLGALLTGKIDTLLLDAFYRNYTYSPVLFVRETAKSRAGIIRDEDILYTIRSQQIDRRGPYAYLLVGEYFYKPSSGWHQGFFLLNEQSELTAFPFSGAYLFPFNHLSPENEWSEIFQKKISELNQDLSEKMK